MGGLLYPCGLIGGHNQGVKVNKGGRLAIAGFFSIWFGDGSLMFVQPIGPRVLGACLRGERGGRGDNYIRSGRKLHTSPHLLLLRLDPVLTLEAFRCHKDSTTLVDVWANDECPFDIDPAIKHQYCCCKYCHDRRMTLQ